MTSIHRRRFLATLGGAGAFFAQRGLFAQALTLTPAQTEGPYYPDRLPLDQDNDLLIINDNITPAVGTVAWISGRVLDRSGQPVRGALVELWQADDRGNYIHSQGINRGTERDTNFQGYGRFLTASTGEYLFRTIKPGLYPGRVRHAHMKVTFPGGRTLITQLYIEGEAGNDGVLNGVPAAQRSAVVRPWNPVANSAVGALATTFDIVLDYTPPETPSASRPTLVSTAGVVNGANWNPGAASGSWITLFGSGLSATTRAWGASDFSGNSLPQSLDGVSVRVNSQPASVYYVSPGQINVLAPEVTADGDAQVTVNNGNGASDALTVPMRRFQPGFFTFPGEYVAAVHGDGSMVESAHPGEVLLLFGTGFGPTSPALPPAQAVSSPAPTANPVKIRVHNSSVPVAFAGLISSGLYQFNVTVPDLPDGDYPVTAEVAGVWAAKFARLRIRR